MMPVSNVLTPEDVLRIEDASLTVLEKTGIFLDHPKALDILSGLGAKVSDDRKRVFIPRDLVKAMLKKTPSSFVCAARDPKNDLEMTQGNLYVRQAGGPINLFDMCHNTVTPLTFKDTMDTAILINSLPNIDIISAMSPQDINLATYDIAVAKGLLETCQKHAWILTVHSSHLAYELKMAEAVAGGREALKKRPLVSGIFCVMDPLRYHPDEIDRLLLFGEYGIPVRVPITSLVGANAPYPLAGALTQINAEFLSSVVIIQALCPGTGAWYYPLLQMLDMKSGRSLPTTPELMLLYGAAAQLGRHYNVPSSFSSGYLADTQSHQAMFHFGANITMAVMQQITEQGAAGAVQSANFISHQALALIDESMGYLKELNKGINVNDETLAVDDIHNCFEKGEYVSSKLTLKSLRKEKRHVPDMLDSRQLTSWNEDPSTIIDRADAKVKKILKESEVIALPADVQAELDGLMKAAEKEFS